MSEQDILEVVDEFTDNLDPTRLAEEAERLGLQPDELLTRIVNETKERMRFDLA